MAVKLPNYEVMAFLRVFFDSTTVINMLPIVFNCIYINFFYKGTISFFSLFLGSFSNNPTNKSSQIVLLRVILLGTHVTTHFLKYAFM
jgi:hypothetical protein